MLSVFPFRVWISHTEKEKAAVSCIMKLRHTALYANIQVNLMPETFVDKLNIIDR